VTRVATVVTGAAVIAGLVSLVEPGPAQAVSATPAIVPVGSIAATPLAQHARQRARLIAETTADVTREVAAAHRVARAAERVATRSHVVDVARKQIGDRYSAGSAGPSAFDCSGLVRYVYRVAAGRDLPHNSRAQYGRVTKIRRSAARPGDLVFFFRGGAHHVGIYIGNGRMIDAPGYGERVRVSPISGSWWSRSYTGMGRVLPA